MVGEHPAGFPVHLTPLVGREREILEVSALLSQEGVRLLTLTGPGGVGKTRLAIAAAQAYGATSGARLCFVDLAPLSQPELVLPAIAQHLNVRETDEEPLEARVISALRDAPMLLVLDNFEQVIGSAVLLPRLLAACPSITILVSSRERLRVSGDQEYEVRPLTLPGAPGAQSPEVLMQAEAVHLFVERARAVRHDFALTTANATAVATICAHLDGLPLAIELAAARINALPPALLLERLEQALPLLTGGGRDRPIRLQTMRDAIAWSYDLLSPNEQALFRQIAIFVGGCTLEAIEGSSSCSNVLETVISLVDRSLLYQEPQGGNQQRFRMLETVRQYGLEQLEASGEVDAMRRRHADYYLKLVSGRNSAIPFAGDFTRVERIAPDQENLRQALKIADEIGDERGLLHLAVANYELWRVGGLGSEAHEWLMKALEQGSDASGEHIAWAYGELGEFAWHRGSYVEAASFFEREMEMAQRSGSVFAAANALCHLGGLAYRDGDLGRATQLLTGAAQSLLSLAPNSSDALSAACVAFSLLGDIAIVQGDYDLAAVHLERSIGMSRSTAWRWILPDALAGLGIVNIQRGNIDQAVMLYLEGIEIANSTGYIPYTVSITFGLAAVAASVGQPERAARLLGAAERLRESIGSAIYPRDQAVLDRCLTMLHTEFDEVQLASLSYGDGTLNPEEIMAEAQTIISTMNGVTGIRNDHARRPFGLTPREIEVLRLVVEGYSDSQIAERLFITRRTVTTHTSSIFGKLGVSGRAEAAAMAVRRDLV